MKPAKITIVGAGDVGSSFAYALAQSGHASEIALLDINKELAKGQVMDLVHGLPFYPSVNIHVGDKLDYADAQVIVIAAGVSQKPGETRFDLLKKNENIMKQIIQDINQSNSQAILVIATNPVDVLTYVALKESGWNRNRVIGSGTVLDSARFRYLISEHCGVDVKNVHAYILGEHGDSEVAAWSMTHLGGIKINDHCTVCQKCENWDLEKKKIEDQVRNSAYHIIDYKGATYYAIGMALVKIVSAIVRNQKSVLTVSTLIKGEYGLTDVCLSVPCIVSDRGVEKIMKSSLSEKESKLLLKSGEIIKREINSLYPL